MRAVTERESEVLKSIVQEYIATGRPVGSRSFVQKYSFSISPATMRNIMYDLESLGFLTHPHTSAGRIPTDTGYRYFVDFLSDSYDISDLDYGYIRDDFMRSEVHLDKMFMSITKMLSSVSRLAGIVLTPNPDFTAVKQIELVSIDPETVLLIIVTRTGVVINKKIAISERVTRDILFSTSNILSSEFAGFSIYDIKTDILGKMRQKYSGSDEQICLDVVELALNSINEQDIFIEGIENILHIPDMIEKEVLTSFLRLIEEKKNLAEIMQRTMDSDSVQTFIGSEIDNSYVVGCSLVACCYKIGNKNAGVLGVIGPTRMDYRKVVPLVDYTGRLVTNFLSNVSR
ncbi:MAG TPA: heat-inducible transcriptional repressor HrcA [Spirochaetota bacterium]|jgi:heat-inducible transcriptional repressor|nr:heat-inducible transcriptional repressor HrcA [Spirochaetota bacterium]HOH37044.1 heat-inducible transcriptional repressor HrcA [Spirochaetota bacterium]HPM34598.1 heat-inducible transcriptional repressor HrcA [Spirochaetota bacterium]HPY02125.1 heat-inducible transcriptional repressor HrcA [Spirochaetota bacterium]HQA52061.1 heat-inducible transcriptional repressor HrcA [Spirochaetota bacterium]